MKQRTASCPSCGAPVVFSPGAVVSVCDFCQSAVARTDKSVEDYGKVADLVDTSTRLRRGLTGQYNGKRFTIVGHVQYRHPAGGVWDEWYLAFPGNRWGWLADAQGQTHMMFERRVKKGSEPPPMDDLAVGSTLALSGTTYSVLEKGIATAVSAEGEIPWRFHSGAEHRFADLRDDQGNFATIEYSDPVSIYMGPTISLEDLQLEGQGWHIDEEKIAVGAAQLNCPNCGGPLTLRVPDKSLRVTCPNCSSMLDVTDGKLSYLHTLKSRESFPTVVPLGSEGELFGTQYTVIGYLKRYVMYQGQSYPWNEYLLYAPTVGYRWLVHNDRHWSFVEPVTKSIKGSPLTDAKIRFDGDSFRVYDRATAYVRYVIGEFYWRVEVGEKVQAADFIAPPRMLSFEFSRTDASQEMNVSIGTYITTDEIEKAFGLQSITRPWSVGMIQPRPQFSAAIFMMWFAFALVLIVIFMAFATSSPQTGSDPWLLFYALVFVSLVPIGIIAYRHSFEVKRWENSDYSPYATE